MENIKGEPMENICGVCGAVVGINNNSGAWITTLSNKEPKPLCVECNRGDD